MTVTIENVAPFAERLATLQLVDTDISLNLVPSEQPGLALFFNDRLVASHQRDGRAPTPTVADVRALFSREGITAARRPGPQEGGDFQL